MLLMLCRPSINKAIIIIIIVNIIKVNVLSPIFGIACGLNIPDPQDGGGREGLTALIMHTHYMIMYS